MFYVQTIAELLSLGTEGATFGQASNTTSRLAKHSGARGAGNDSLSVPTGK